MQTDNKVKERRLPLAADLALIGALALVTYAGVATALGGADWALAVAITLVAIGGRFVARYLP
tara:strand:+ start:743 stop:931 length:189 start_codon:yes stop_codon:yes gene_type:complete